MKNDISTKPLLVVDLNSGKYWNDKIGHECYNLDRNKDGKYYNKKLAYKGKKTNLSKMIMLGHLLITNQTKHRYGSRRKNVIKTNQI